MDDFSGSYPKPPAIADTSAWLTKDASWVEARKDAWRTLAPTLKVLERSARELKAIEVYYLTGKCAVPLKWGAHEYPSIPLLFRLWMHPDQSAVNWAAQVAATVWEDYDISVRMLRALGGGNGPGLGGAEARLCDALLDGSATRCFLDVNRYAIGRIAPTERSLGAYHLEVGFADLRLALELPEKNPRLLQRFVIRTWLRKPEHTVWSKLFANRHAVSHMHRAFHLIRFKASPDGASASTPAQVELAKELLALFDQGGGPEQFQQAWRAHGATDAWKTEALKPYRQ